MKQKTQSTCIHLRRLHKYYVQKKRTEVFTTEILSHVMINQYRENTIKY